MEKRQAYQLYMGDREMETCYLIHERQSGR